MFRRYRRQRRRQKQHNHYVPTVLAVAPSSTQPPDQSEWKHMVSVLDQSSDSLPFDERQEDTYTELFHLHHRDVPRCKSATCPACRQGPRFVHVPPVSPQHIRRLPRKWWDACDNPSELVSIMKSIFTTLGSQPTTDAVRQELYKSHTATTEDSDVSSLSSTSVQSASASI